jgi:hypothetical protein
MLYANTPKNKVKKLVLLIALFCFFGLYTAKAQIASVPKHFGSTVKGMVVDSATHAALRQLTVTVYESSKILPFKTTLTNDNGAFEITELPSNLYQLTFTYFGYKSISIKLPAFTISQIDVGQIALANLVQQLPEVRITTKKPLIEQDLDKLTYNVEADPESQTATTLEILRKIPMLTIDADDNLQLNGNSNYRVFINGKPSLLLIHNESDVFKNMAASAIKTIEVITNPSSRYEAEGIGGIINITTYKKNIGGYNGDVNLQASNPEGYSTSGNITASFGKLSFATNYGYATNTSPSNNSVFIRQDKIHQNKLQQFGVSNGSNWTYNWGNELTYELNELNQLTARYNTNNGEGNSRSVQQVTLLNAFNETAQAYENRNEATSNVNAKDFGVDFRRNFKKNNAQQLTFSYRWRNDANNNNSNFILLPLFNYSDQVTLTQNNDEAREQSLQTDYIQPIKKHSLELGVSTISRHNVSDYFYKNRDSGTNTFLIDTSQSNQFNYKEMLVACYLSLNMRWGRWGLRVGGRMEQSKIDARFTSSGTIAKQTYLNIIPNLTFSRQLKGASIIKLAYNQRINRPDLYYLNPYIDRTDPWNISYGNPYILPALAHIFNASYFTTIKRTYISLTAFHQFTNNAIQQITTLGTDTIARTTFGNIGQNKNFSLALSTNTTVFQKLGINLNSNLNYVKYRRSSEGKSQVNKGLTYNVFGAANLRLKKWRAGMSISYAAPNILMQVRTASYTASNITINRNLLKDKNLTVGLAVNNPFQKNRHSIIEINEPTFYQLQNSFTQLRRINISINYRFTKVQDGTNRKSHDPMDANKKANRLQ